MRNAYNTDIELKLMSKDVEKLKENVKDISDVIPAEVSDTNKLADKDWVLSEIAGKSTVTVSETGTSETMANYITVDGTEYKLGGSGPSGTTDYNDLENKPTLNGETIEGNKTSEEYHINGLPDCDEAGMTIKTEQEYSAIVVGPIDISITPIFVNHNLDREQVIEAINSAYGPIFAEGENWFKILEFSVPSEPGDRKHFLAVSVFIPSEPSDEPFYGIDLISETEPGSRDYNTDYEFFWSDNPEQCWDDDIESFLNWFNSGGDDAPVNIVGYDEPEIFSSVVSCGGTRTTWKKATPDIDELEEGSYNLEVKDGTSKELLVDGKSYHSLFINTDLSPVRVCQIIDELFSRLGMLASETFDIGEVYDESAGEWVYLTLCHFNNNDTYWIQASNGTDLFGYPKADGWYTSVVTDFLNLVSSYGFNSFINEAEFPSLQELIYAGEGGSGSGKKYRWTKNNIPSVEDLDEGKYAVEVAYADGVGTALNSEGVYNHIYINTKLSREQVIEILDNAFPDAQDWDWFDILSDAYNSWPMKCRKADNGNWWFGWDDGDVFEAAIDTRDGGTWELDTIDRHLASGYPYSADGLQSDSVYEKLKMLISVPKKEYSWSKMSSSDGYTIYFDKNKRNGLDNYPIMYKDFECTQELNEYDDLYQILISMDKSLIAPLLRRIVFIDVTNASQFMYGWLGELDYIYFIRNISTETPNYSGFKLELEIFSPRYFSFSSGTITSPSGESSMYTFDRGYVEDSSWVDSSSMNLCTADYTHHQPK